MRRSPCRALWAELLHFRINTAFELHCSSFSLPVVGKGDVAGGVSSGMNASPERRLNPVGLGAPRAGRALNAVDAARLRRMQRLARLLDTAVRLPGTQFRVGADGLIGLIPGIGDLAGGAFAAYIIVEAARLGLPRHVLLRMLANLGLDMAVGSVPLLGDIFDMAFKANRRNVNLVERYLSNTGTVDTSAAPR